MSYFHASILSRDRGVMPRLLVREKTAGFDGFISQGFTVIVIVSHEWQYLKRKDSQTALYRMSHIFQSGGHTHIYPLS